MNATAPMCRATSRRISWPVASRCISTASNGASCPTRPPPPQRCRTTRSTGGRRRWPDLLPVLRNPLDGYAESSTSLFGGMVVPVRCYPCFPAVKMTERIAANISTPTTVRKPTVLFIRCFIMRISRSTSLLMNGTSESAVDRSTSALRRAGGAADCAPSVAAACRGRRACAGVAPGPRARQTPRPVPHRWQPRYAVCRPPPTPPRRPRGLAHLLVRRAQTHASRYPGLALDLDERLELAQMVRLPRRVAHRAGRSMP